VRARFPHAPDPTVANLAQVAAIMEPVGAHVGFGLSSDCERVAMVTGDGLAIGRRGTLPLVAEHLLAARAPDGRKATKEPTLVAGVTCDSRVYRVAERYGGKVVGCGVGVQTVIERMRIEVAAAGGDDSGGVAIASLQLAYDGLAVIAFLLEAVATRGSARDLADALPAVHARTTTLPCPISNAYSTVARIREHVDPQRIRDLDGLRVDLDDGWYHVRVSHTEPVIRVTAEADSAELADELIARVKSQLRAVLPS